MNNSNLIMSSIDPEDLKQMIRDAVDDAISLKMEAESTSEEEFLLTRKEVADFYKISLVTLRQWEKDSIIPNPIRKGSRVYFRQSEIYADIRAKGKN